MSISIEDTMCISKEWLDKEIFECDAKVKYWTRRVANNDKHLQDCINELNQFSIKLHTLTLIKSQLFPSTVLVEKAFNKGFVSGKNYDLVNRSYLLNTFLTSPITLNIEENGK